MTINFLQHPDGWFWFLVIAAIITFFWIIRAIKSNRMVLSLIILRICVLIALVIILLQPKITWRENYITPLRWNVYADRSVSMGYHQSISADSYINGIQSVMASLSKKAANTQAFLFDHEIIEVDDHHFRLDGEATDLEKVINHINRSESELSGAVIITDGQITKGAQQKNIIENLTVPIYTIGVGDTVPLVDISIKEINIPTVIIKGEEMDIDVSLVANGITKERINVLLYEKKKLIGSKYVQLHGHGSISQIKFKTNPQDLGEIQYSIKATVLTDEINIENNIQKVNVTVLKNKYRVALITGAPNYNTGPLKNIIQKIPRIELDHYIQKGDSFKPAFSQFWSTPYELIIFDNYPIKPISNKWQQVFAKKIIAQRSSLFLIAGPNTNNPNTKAILPFFQVEDSEILIENNDSQNWYWSENNSMISELSDKNINAILPPLVPSIIIESNNANSILAIYENSEIPLLSCNENEGLRSSIWTAADFYTLFYRLMDSGQENLGQNIFTGIFSWLLKTSGEEELYFRLNKNMFQQGENIHVTGSHYDLVSQDNLSFTGSIELMNEANEKNKYEIHYNPNKEQWAAHFMAGKPGKYTYDIYLHDGNKEYHQKGDYIVEESQIELNHVSIDSYFLASIANTSKGQYFPWSSRAELLNVLKQEQNEEILVKNARINENIIFMIFILTLLTAEWYIRRFIGLS